jgi:hypothetical protein
MPGGGMANMILTLGYDPQKQRFVGTWVGSMMTHLWVYQGALEDHTLTLETEGPDMSGSGGMGRYRDVIDIESGDSRVLSSYFQGPDGAWQRFMTARYRRKS